MNIFTPIADFDAGVEGLQLYIITWSGVISEPNNAQKTVRGRGCHMTPLVVGRLIAVWQGQFQDMTLSIRKKAYSELLRFSCKSLQLSINDRRKELDHVALPRISDRM